MQYSSQCVSWLVRAGAGDQVPSLASSSPGKWIRRELAGGWWLVAVAVAGPR